MTQFGSLLTFAFCLFLVIVICDIIQIKREKKDFNNGICPVCGREMISCGRTDIGRIYGCDCGHRALVEKHIVDNRYVFKKLGL